MSDTKHTTQENLSRAKVLARRHHETLWLGSRFLDQSARQRAEAALAIDSELLRIASVVTEPTMGQIRYQWWLDQLESYRAHNTASLAGDSFLIALTLGDDAEVLAPLLEKLIESREALFLSENSHSESHQPLFELLNTISAEFHDVDSGLSDLQAKLYAVLDSSEIDAQDVRAMAEAVLRAPEACWPVLSTFVLLPDWLKGRQRSPLGRRWKVLSCFLKGEKPLARDLLSLSDKMTL